MIYLSLTSFAWWDIRYRKNSIITPAFPLIVRDPYPGGENLNTVTGSTGFLPADMVVGPPRLRFGSSTNSKPPGGAKFR